MSTHDPRGGGDDPTVNWPAHQRGQGPAGQPPYPQHHQVPPGPPSGWYPPTPPPVPAPTGKRRRRGLVIGAAFLAGIVVAAGAVVTYELTVGRDDGAPTASKTTNTWPPPKASRPPTTPGARTPSPTPSAPPGPQAAPGGNADPAALRAMLLPAAELDELLQTSGMEPGSIGTEFATGATVDPSECVSAWAALNQNTYAAVPTTGVAGQVVGEKPKPYHQVIQGVVAFPDEAAAKKFVNDQVSTWARCESRSLDYEWGDATEHVDIGKGVVTVGPEGSLLSLPVTRAVTDGAPLKCERAMIARLNVVVDVRACKPTEPLAAQAVAKAIAQKIAG